MTRQLRTDERIIDAMKNETVRQSAEALRRLTLWCSLLAIRLGDGIPDTAVQTMPAGFVP